MMRLDKLLVLLGFFPSREKAQDAIIQKTVRVNGELVTKPSKEVDESADIEIIDIFNKYVSRGGLKLEKAIIDFGLDFNGKTVLDVGASTGGFTDCALQHGAAHVVAIDVGSNQLHPSLQQHPQVTSLENTDFRQLLPEQLPIPQFDYIVTDVSFISLTCLFPYFKTFLKENGQMVLLIKPQFEAGSSFLNKNGIVTDEKGYKIAIHRVEQEALQQQFHLNKIAISTLFEKNKNVEFLTIFSLTDNHFRLDYNTLFKDVKETKKRISGH